MIPNSYSDDNIWQNRNSISECNTDVVPKFYDDIHLNGSQTDKPQMAHDIYKRLLENSSLRNYLPQSSSMKPLKTSSSNNLSNNLMKNSHCLIAAYVGCNLMYCRSV